jgi:hypothetical protein
MQRSLEGKKYTTEEICTLLLEAAQIDNSRPIVSSLWAEGEPHSHKDVAVVPPVKFETGLQLVKRFRMIQEAKEEFWNRWAQEIFPSLLRQKKMVQVQTICSGGRRHPKKR